VLSVKSHNWSSCLENGIESCCVNELCGGGLKTLSSPIGANKSRCSPASISPRSKRLRHSGVPSCVSFPFFVFIWTVLLLWTSDDFEAFETFETDRSGDRWSIADDLRTAREARLGLSFVLGVLGLDLSGAGDRGFGVLGVRGVFGVGGSFLWK
jgi:hypothetical protein